MRQILTQKNRPHPKGQGRLCFAQAKSKSKANPPAFQASPFSRGRNTKNLFPLEKGEAVA